MRAGLVVLVSVLACGAPRPARPQLAGFRSEAEVFADVQRRLVALGHGAAASARLSLEPELLLGYYRDGVVHMRAVFAPAADIEARLDRLVRGIYGERAAVFYAEVGSRADATRAFGELGVLAIAHELFHHVRLSVRVTADPFDVFAEEDVAMQLEHAFLATLVTEGVVDRGWLDRYARLQRAFVAACRPDLVAALPASVEDRRALFDAIAVDSFAALGAIAAGEPNPAPDLVQQRTALYALRRVELATARPRRFAEVAAELLGARR